MGRYVLGLSLLFATLPGSALPDEVRLTDGRTLAPGSVVAIGPSRLLFDGERTGLIFCERRDVAAVLDAQGRPREWAQAAAAEQDPVGVVTKLVGAGVRVRRQEEEVPVALHGVLAVIREGDLLRTGPYGRATLTVPGGGVLTARSDALVRFQDGRAALLEGVLHAEHADGSLSVSFAEARVDASEGQTVLERLRGRTRITCLAGRSVVTARDGWRVELPRNHSLDVKPEAGQEPASLAASNANAWPVRLEFAGKWVSIQPGERLILLLGAAPPAATGPAPQAGPAPQVTGAPPPPAAAPAVGPPPAESGEVAGRVLRAGGAFSLDRGGATRQVDRAQAGELGLLPGDRLESGEGEVALEVGGARVRMLPRSRLLIAPPEGGPTRLLAGEATLETDGRATLAFSLGEVGLVKGAVAVRAGEQEASVALRQGTAGARFGLEVRVPLVPGGEVQAVQSGARLQLSTPPGGLQLSPDLGTLQARLRPGQTLAFTRTGEQQVVELPGARVELLGAVRAEVVAGPGEVDQLQLEDGRRFPLAGTLRFARGGDRIEVLSGAEAPLAAAPPPVAPPPAPLAAPAAPVPPAPEAPAPPAAPAGSERHVLANGAVVFARDWGQLVVKRQVGTEVEVEGPQGSLWFGAHARASLERLRGGRVRIDANDGRFVDWESGGLPFELRLHEDGRLQISIDRGSLRRTVDVEAGCEFDLLIRPDHARAFVFGQVKYVEPGQAVSVARRSGLRTQVAAERR